MVTLRKSSSSLILASLKSVTGKDNRALESSTYIYTNQVDKIEVNPANHSRLTGLKLKESAVENAGSRGEELK